ncbi:prolyl oligopeptidase family serine peptidase [Brevundimonas sp.]|uniref:alpha/beta hydrolase family protein n=1 Tax=Brevundimonas sp. TaxID=1871086 RepID=UPI0025C3ABE4|nr:prolyl oligopeptidase family serine peptidase [Brevundimonas sp.]
MKFLSSTALSAVLFLAPMAGVAFAQSTPASTTHPAAPTIEQFAAFPLMSSFTVSPDGKHIAALQARGEDRVILVWDAEHLDREPTVIGSSQMKLQGVSFVKNDVLGVSLWQPYDASAGTTIKTFLGKFMLTDLQGRNWRDPINSFRPRSSDEAEFLKTQSPNVLDSLPNDPDNILIEINGDVLRLNVRSNRSERIQRSSERVVGYSTDLNGELRVRVIADRDANGFFIATQFRNASGGWEEHFRSHVKNREVFSVTGFSTDPNIAYVISNRGRDKAAVFEYNIASKTLGEAVFEHPLFEATGMDINRIRGPHFGEVRSFTYNGPRETDFPIAPGYESLVTGLSQALNVENHPLRATDPATGVTRTISYPTDRYMNVTAASQDWSTVVVWAGASNDPGAYYIFRNGQLTPLGQPNPQINPATIGKTELVYYKARDGLDIPGFLSKPPAEIFGPGPYPTVIMPHGGPWARDEMTWDYSSWRAMLTSRGYAVLQPQYQGSDGWGKRLWMAGDNEWGQKMQDDKDDGAKWLIDQGVAQQGRIAMFGFSYGGYAAMVAGIRPEGIYKCAIAGAGVSDLTKIRSSMFQNPYTREAQRDTVNGLNPITRANQIQIPMMVFTGDRDRTVTQDHSDLFVGRARGSSQDVQYHLIKDYAHGPAWTRAIMAEQLGYIDDYLRTGCGGSGL